LPRTVWWDDFTGHIYFTLGLGHRIIKWHPDNGYVGHCDDVAIPAGWGIQSDFNYPINGKYWAAADYDVTLVNLVTMKIERRIDLTDFATTFPAHLGGTYEKFTHSAVIMTYDGMFKYPLERYGNDSVALSGVLIGYLPEGWHGSHQRHFQRRQPVFARICREPPHGCTRGAGAASRDRILSMPWKRTGFCASCRVGAQPWPPLARMI
jgi:hypothetical protein